MAPGTVLVRERLLKTQYEWDVHIDAPRTHVTCIQARARIASKATCSRKRVTDKRAIYVTNPCRDVDAGQNRQWEPKH